MQVESSFRCVSDPGHRSHAQLADLLSSIERFEGEAIMTVQASASLRLNAKVQLVSLMEARPC